MSSCNLYRYFSQYGEDFLLWHFFDFKPHGFFVDIGAFDGVHLSNSYSFELSGWGGICVEPHPYYFNLCRENRPNSVCINKACGREERQKVVFNVDNTGLFSSLLDISLAENLKGHFGHLQGIQLNIDSIEVDIVPLNSILDGALPDCQIDFISIDVEGAELDVFFGFDLDKYRPRVIVVETNTPDAVREIGAWLGGKGYMFARRTNANSFYVTSETDREKINSIELSCLIEKQIHPLGIEYTVPAYLNGVVIYKGNSCKIFAQLDELERRKQLHEQERENNKKLDAAVEDLAGLLKRKDDKLLEASKEIGSLRDEIRSRDKIIQGLNDKLHLTFEHKIRRLIRRIGLVR